ncbi:MAG: helix-hairpin-helix domain-containing protein [Anaerolineae bacterium]
MEELLVIVIGVGAVALSPLVPALRPVAKVAVKGTLVIAGVAAAAGHKLEDMRSKGKANGVADGAAAVAEVAEVAEAEAPTAEAATEAAPAETAVAEMSAAETPAAEMPAAETPAAEAAPAAAETSHAETVAPKPGLIDIDGIGPKVVSVLAAADVTSLEQVAAMDEAQLREILAKAGPNYRLMDPTSWPEQARRLLAGDR